MGFVFWIFYYRNPLYLRNSILKTPFTHEIFISKSSKIIKDNSGISKNVGVQEENYRNAKRNIFNDLKKYLFG